MPRSHTLTRALTAALATTALAAPAAVAQPIDSHGTGTTQAAADLRSPDTKNAAQPLPGPPTWPEHPQPINVTRAQTGDADGTPWATIGLGLAGAGLIAGGATAVAGRTRRRARQPRIAA